MRSPGMPVQEDASGIARGVAGLASGVGQAAQALDVVATREKDQENTVDIARAEAARTAAYLKIQNQFATDPEYATFGDRAKPLIDDAATKAASLIRDERMRQRWLATSEEGQLRMLDAVMDVGRGKKADAERGALITSLEHSSALMSDPGVPQVVRDKVEKDVAATIYMAKQTGILSAERAAELTEQFVRGARIGLASNIVEMDLLNGRAAYVARGMGIPGANVGSSVLEAQAVADGAPVPMLDYDLAKVTAGVLGDANFPEDPKEAAAYLSDPGVAQDYAEAAQDHLMKRYRGDLGAVVIAMDPKGGTALADRWMASDHDEAVLPRPVKERYVRVMGSLTSQQSYSRIPIVSDGVDVRIIDPNVLSRFEQLQSVFGEALPLIAGSKSSPVNDRGVTFDVTNLNDEDRARLVQIASAMGFTGIGIGKNSIKLNATGERHAWNEDGGNVPAWAKDAVANHLAGKTEAIAALTTTVAPEYQELPFDVRVRYKARALQEMAQTELTLKASLQTVVDNAPAAFQATGKYDGRMPTRLDFIQAYGAVEGTQRGQAFDRAVDTAKLIYQFRTMPNAQIEASLANAQLTSGNTARVDAERYSALRQAAEETLKARAADPAGYAAAAFPAVAQAWENVGKDPATLGAALMATVEAQKSLGIESPAYLPKSVADGAVGAFNDKTKPAAERVGAVSSLLMASTDPVVQKQVYDQLVAAGLPETTRAAVAAMARGDTDAAKTLIRAVLVDPTSMGPKFNDDATTARIAEEIRGQMFQPGQIGDIIYGTSGASADGLTRLSPDLSLIDRAAKLRLIDGTARDAREAVELTIKDMYGDVQIVDGTGTSLGGPGIRAKVTIPSDADKQTAKLGLRALGSLVRQKITEAMIRTGTNWRATAEERAQVSLAARAHVDSIMAEGWFENAGDGAYGFYDPYSDGLVTGPDGKPIIFTLQQVMSNGREEPGAQQPGGGW